MDFADVKRALASDAQAVCARLLPDGKVHGREWVSDPGTGKIKVVLSGAKAGVWSHFGGDGGGDMIDLWAYATGLSVVKAFAEAREFLGWEEPKFSGPAKKYSRPEKPKCQAPKSAVYKYLADDRGILQKAIEAYRVGEEGRNMVFPYLVGGELVLWKKIGIDRKDGKKFVQASKDSQPCLFGWQAIPEDAKTVVICEGEIDALTWWQAGFPALSVPFGAGGGNKQQWLEFEYDRLARFEVIYLAFDNDEEGDKAVEDILPRLGRHRCLRVMHEGAKDANASVLAGHDLAAAIASAKSMDPEELRDSSEYFGDVMELFYPTKKETTGYLSPWMDFELRFRPSEMTVWQGATGAGKTEVLCHCSTDWVNQGAKVCVASFEMVPAQLLKRMFKQASGLDRASQPYLQIVNDWFAGNVKIIGRTGKMDLQSILEIFSYARRRYGCDIFIIDSLMRLDGVGREDFDAQEKVAFDCANWALDNGVHLNLVCHSRKGPREGAMPDSEDIAGAKEIGGNAMNIVGIWRRKDIERLPPEQREGRPPVMLNCSKQRNGDWEGAIGAEFDTNSHQYLTSRDNGTRSYVEYDERFLDAAE